MRLGSIVIPAHNEAAVIASCLSGLYADPRMRAVDVVVVCNGCTDGTADVVRGLDLPVRLLETDQPSKPAAIRLAETVTDAMPRLYVDSDVVLSGTAAIDVLARLTASGPLAARPSAMYDTSRSSALVRRFYAARAGAPTLAQLLCGAGVYGLSQAGRARFGKFPDVVGDDLFVDRLFDRDEIEVVDCAPVVVRAPRTTRDLITMLRRSYRGKSEAQSLGSSPAPAWRTLVQVLDYGRHGGRQSVDAATYVGVALAARLSRHTAREVRWERDESSRAA